MGRRPKTDLEPQCCNAGARYRVEAMVSVDERGQMVLPKELRESAGIGAGDKLVVLSWRDESGVCCISLVKTDYFLSIVEDRLGPMMGELAIQKTPGGE